MTKANTTAQDLVSKAVEEKLVVPAQAEGETVEVTTMDTTDQPQPELVLIEGDKKSPKDRLKDLVEKAKNNKQFFVGVAVGLVSGVVLTAQFVKERVDEAIVEMSDEEPADTEDVVTDETVA